MFPGQLVERDPTSPVGLCNLILQLKGLKFHSYSLPYLFHTVGQRKKVTAVTSFPARPRLDQTAQIRAKYTKFPLMKSRDFRYRMDVTRSQLSANTGIPVCLVREIWQFKVFMGKEVTPFHEEGNSLQFRAGKKATHFHYKWFIYDIRYIWYKTEHRERSQCEIVNWKYVLRCDEQMKTTFRVAMSGTR